MHPHYAQMQMSVRHPYLDNVLGSFACAMGRLNHAGLHFKHESKLIYSHVIIIVLIGSDILFVDVDVVEPTTYCVLGRYYPH